MKFKIRSVFTILIILLISITVMAAGTYIKDDANVLNKSTVETINNNFNKLEKNTGAKIRFYTISSLQGKDINEVAAKIIKEDPSNKQVVFVVAIKEHKNKIIAGSGLSSVFNSSELNKIAGLPNNYFKNKDFNTGLLKVGQAIDQDITTKAIKNGNVTVKSDGYSTTVEPKKSHTGLIIFIILLIAVIAGVVYYLKVKVDKDAREFARKNGLKYDAPGGNKIKSANMKESSSNSNSSKHVNHDDMSTNYKSSQNSYKSSQNKVYNDDPVNVIHTHNAHHTTVINNSGHNDGFLEGMIVNEMLHDHHEPVHHEEERHEYNDASSYNSYNNDDNKTSSGDW